METATSGVRYRMNFSVREIVCAPLFAIQIMYVARLRCSIINRLTFDYQSNVAFISRKYLVFEKI